MVKTKWHNIQKTLREQDDVPAPQQESEFWREFRIRAAQPVQDEESGPALPFWPRVQRTIWAAAALAVIVSVVGLSLRNTTTPGSDSPLMSEVQEINVTVPYSSIMVMRDVETGATMVWVSDPQESQNGS
ncbi:MAG: hypothetical protein HN742_12060 [Lentisphaerae bacterium]|jgi:hypothetical protein|nr:hypothetical protein [Lentisphaerota bacterium]MBT4820115.1 hypothetical protein [Lentisphaerota bacterium]MBT5610561.1 hypothetical protein [Lentisphaerota bacterium]MBT7054433.1 hypothetical protein [Lentisphaerota bacterium]MBT7842602.1 hypothetical protein [Lentisphaerota bacterium]